MKFKIEFINVRKLKKQEFKQLHDEAQDKVVILLNFLSKFEYFGIYATGTVEAVKWDYARKLADAKKKDTFLKMISELDSLIDTQKTKYEAVKNKRDKRCCGCRKKCNHCN